MNCSCCHWSFLVRLQYRPASSSFLDDPVKDTSAKVKLLHGSGKGSQLKGKGWFVVMIWNIPFTLFPLSRFSLSAHPLKSRISGILRNAQTNAADSITLSFTGNCTSFFCKKACQPVKQALRPHSFFTAHTFCSTVHTKHLPLVHISVSGTNRIPHFCIIKTAGKRPRQYRDPCVFVLSHIGP